jgi:hypothetical protein
VVACLVADIFEADRIELVQRAELAVEIPPFLGHGAEFFQLTGVDRRFVFSACRGGSHGPSYQRHLSGIQRLSMDTPPLPDKVAN